jgi:hypothetical protein
MAPTTTPPTPTRMLTIAPQSTIKLETKLSEEKYNDRFNDVTTVWEGRVISTQQQSDENNNPPPHGYINERVIVKYRFQYATLHPVDFFSCPSNFHSLTAIFL